MVHEAFEPGRGVDPHSRTQLAHGPLNGFGEHSEAEVEQLWLAEAARRDAEVDAGAPTHSAEEVLARAHARRE